MKAGSDWLAPKVSLARRAYPSTALLRKAGTCSGDTMLRRQDTVQSIGGRDRLWLRTGPPMRVKPGERVADWRNLEEFGRGHNSRISVHLVLEASWNLGRQTYRLEQKSTLLIALLLYLR